MKFNVVNLTDKAIAIASKTAALTMSIGMTLFGISVAKAAVKDICAMRKTKTKVVIAGLKPEANSEKCEAAPKKPAAKKSTSSGTKKDTNPKN